MPGYDEQNARGDYFYTVDAALLRRLVAVYQEHGLSLDDSVREVLIDRGILSAEGKLTSGAM